MLWWNWIEGLRLPSSIDAIQRDFSWEIDGSTMLFILEFMFEVIRREKLIFGKHSLSATTSWKLIYILILKSWFNVAVELSCIIISCNFSYTLLMFRGLLICLVPEKVSSLHPPFPFGKDWWKSVEVFRCDVSFLIIVNLNTNHIPTSEFQIIL